jgi:hypothetical protein
LLQHRLCRKLKRDTDWLSLGKILEFPCVSSEAGGSTRISQPALMPKKVAPILKPTPSQPPPLPPPPHCSASIASRTQPGQVAIVFVGKVRFRHDGDLGVADPQEESEVERIIVAAIERSTREGMSKPWHAASSRSCAAGLEIRRAQH